MINFDIFGFASCDGGYYCYYDKNLILFFKLTIVTLLGNKEVYYPCTLKLNDIIPLIIYILLIVLSCIIDLIRYAFIIITNKLLPCILILYSTYFLYAKTNIPDPFSIIILLNTTLVIYTIWNINLVNEYKHNIFTNLLNMLKNPMFIIHGIMLNLLFFFPRQFLIAYANYEGYEIICIIFIVGVNFMTLPPLIRTMLNIYHEKILNGSKIIEIFLENCQKNISGHKVLFMGLSITIFRFFYLNLEYIPFFNGLFTEYIKPYLNECYNKNKYIFNYSVNELIIYVIMHLIVYIGEGWNNSNNVPYVNNGGNVTGPVGGSGGPGGPSPNDLNVSLAGAESNTDENDLPVLFLAQPLQNNPNQVNNVEWLYSNLSFNESKRLNHIATQQRVDYTDLIRELCANNIKPLEICAPRKTIGYALVTTKNQYNNAYKCPDPIIERLVHNLLKVIYDRHVNDYPKVNVNKALKPWNFTLTEPGSAITKFSDIRGKISALDLALFKACVTQNLTHYGALYLKNKTHPSFEDNTLIFNSSVGAYNTINILQSLGLRKAISEPSLRRMKITSLPSCGIVDERYFNADSGWNSKKSSEIFSKVCASSHALNIIPTAPQDSNIIPHNLYAGIDMEEVFDTIKSNYADLKKSAKGFNAALESENPSDTVNPVNYNTNLNVSDIPGDMSGATVNPVNYNTNLNVSDINSATVNTVNYNTNFLENPSDTVNPANYNTSLDFLENYNTSLDFLENYNTSLDFLEDPSFTVNPVNYNTNSLENPSVTVNTENYNTNFLEDPSFIVNSENPSFIVNPVNYNTNNWEIPNATVNPANYYTNNWEIPNATVNTENYNTNLWENPSAIVNPANYNTNFSERPSPPFTLDFGSYPSNKNEMVLFEGESRQNTSEVIHQNINSRYKPRFNSTQYIATPIHFIDKNYGLNTRNDYDFNSNAIYNLQGFSQSVEKNNNIGIGHSTHDTSLLGNNIDLAIPNSRKRSLEARGLDDDDLYAPPSPKRNRHF